MPKTIRMNLDSKSIDAAIKSLKHYQKLLDARNEQLVDKLGKLGEEYVQENSQYTDCDAGTTNHKSVRDAAKHTATCDVNWSGDEITFIEFGAGVFFNNVPHGSLHPKGKQMEMTIGDYGYHQGLKESWKKPDGEYTHGTPALMPMWRAINSEDGITKMVGQVGREVFDR